MLTVGSPLLPADEVGRSAFISALVLIIKTGENKEPSLPARDRTLVRVLEPRVGGGGVAVRLADQLHLRAQEAMQLQGWSQCLDGGSV